MHMGLWRGGLVVGVGLSKGEVHWHPFGKMARNPEHCLVWARKHGLDLGSAADSAAANIITIKWLHEHDRVLCLFLSALKCLNTGKTSC